MEHMKKKKGFSRRDLLYKGLLFVVTVTLIVYFLPRDGKFNYQFDINKPWKYGQLIATFDFPIYKDDAVVNREQDSLLASFQPYYLLDKQVEKDAIAKLKENYHTHLKGILPSVDYLRYIERTIKRNIRSGHRIDRKHTRTPQGQHFGDHDYRRQARQLQAYRSYIYGQEGLRVLVIRRYDPLQP